MSQLKYELEMHKIRMAQEKERAQKKAREKAAAYVNAKKARQLVSNESAVVEWEANKINELR